MTILRALYVLEAQTENKKLTETLVEVRKDVEAGLPLSRRAGAPPEGLQPAVRRDDPRRRDRRRAGQLADARRRPAREGRRAAPPGQVRRWPTRLVVITFALIVADRARRRSSSRSSSASSSSSAATCRRSRSSPSRLSNIVTGYWYVLIVGTVGAVFGFRKWKSTHRGREPVGRVPPAHADEDRRHRPEGRARPLVADASARWSRAGVPLLQALEITGKTAGNCVVEKAMDDVIESVKRGGTIAGPLKERPVFPGMVGHMVGVGEETGALDTMLSKIADFYEDQVEAAVKSLTVDPRADHDRRRRRASSASSSSRCTCRCSRCTTRSSSARSEADDHAAAARGAHRGRGSRRVLDRDALVRGDSRPSPTTAETARKLIVALDNAALHLEGARPLRGQHRRPGGDDVAARSLERRRRVDRRSRACCKGSRSRSTPAGTGASTPTASPATASTCTCRGRAAGRSTTGRTSRNGITPSA